MKTRNFVLAAIAVALAASVRAAPAPSGEDKLIADLANAKPAQTHGICAQLKRIGTAKCVPALATILTDDLISYSAREALERIPGKEATMALADAVAKTKGDTRIAILNSLGERRDPAGVAAAKAQLDDADPAIASAAAAALGKMGGADAAGALKAALAKAPDAQKPPIADGMLRCAEAMVAAGQPASAAVYKDLLAAKIPDHMKAAAQRGVIVAAGEEGIAILEKGLVAGDKALVSSAGPLIQQLPAPMTKSVAAMISRIPPAAQIVVIDALGQRGDAAAAPAVAAALGSSDVAVRSAALRALGYLGDRSTVTLLAKAAIDTGTQPAAREALVRLKGEGVREMIVAGMTGSDVRMAAELIRAAGMRRDPAAAGALLKVAAQGEESLRIAAINALGTAADAAAVPELAQIVAAAKSDEVIAAGDKALSAIGSRLVQKAFLSAPIAAAIKNASPAARIALVRVIGPLGGEASLKATREAIAQNDPALKEAGIRSIANSPEPAAIPDLLALSKDAPDVALKVIALRGCVRLIGDANIAAEEKIKHLEAAMSVAARDDDKKLVLGGVGKVAHPGALKLAEPCLADAATKQEAVMAYWQIAQAIAPTHKAEAIEACQVVAKNTSDHNLGKAAVGLSRKLGAR